MLFFLGGWWFILETPERDAYREVPGGRTHMLHCVVVALSTGFTSLHAPLRAPHVHHQSVTRPVLHQRTAAAVGVPAVDEDAAECRASAMEAQSKESDPVAVARGEMKQGLVHHDAAPCWSQGCRVRRQKGDPAPAAQLLCDNRGPIQASRISLGSGMGPVQRSARRVLRPVMLVEEGRGLQVKVQPAAFALFWLMQLFPDAHLAGHAFNIMYWLVLLREVTDPKYNDIQYKLWARNCFLYCLCFEIGLLLLGLALYITA